MSLRREMLMDMMDAKGDVGIGNVAPADDFGNIIFSLATDGGGDAAATIKFQGSAAKDKPDFSAAQSVTNLWDYIEVVDLNTGAAIDGDTGISVATADDYRQLEANINGMRWVSVKITAITAGEITVKGYLFSND